MRDTIAWTILAGIGGAIAFLASTWAIYAASRHVFLWTAWLGLGIGLTLSCVGTSRIEAEDRKQEPTTRGEEK